MMVIQWRDSLSVGNDYIDNDHKHLFVLINEYEVAIKLRDVAILEDTFKGLVDYVHSHFEREQNLMEAVHFPERHVHAEHHRVLVDRVGAFHKNLMTDKKIDLEKASKFLHDWLIDHVINEDLKLKPYVTGKRV